MDANVLGVLYALYFSACIAVGIYGQKRHEQGGVITALISVLLTPLLIGLIVFSITPKGEIETSTQRKVKYTLLSAGGICVASVCYMLFTSVSDVSEKTKVEIYSHNSSTEVNRELNTNPKIVTKEQFGDRWPFAKNEGTVDCTPDLKTGGKIISIEFDGIDYALNGLALDHHANSIPNELWLKDSRTGLKKDISPIVDRARDVCRE
ncbi:DUF2511 domain-containing protein [Armatimonas sp.]|uniref:DUF2511 domain-containing protein n=1 Tax=Armatimonas sp. TaxID=1872638 RepID=UPI00286A83CE|nr:DUF2511 domain-containing protein [Armatimonas sp.]